MGKLCAFPTPRMSARESECIAEGTRWARRGPDRNRCREESGGEGRLRAVELWLWNQAWQLRSVAESEER